MKFIHTSDWHIGRSLCGTSLLDDQRHFLTQFMDFLAEERPDAVLIAGDVYDRPVPSAEAMALVDDFFCRTVLNLQIPVLAIAGNHDSGDRLSYERDFLAKAGLHIAGTLSVPTETVTLSDEWGDVCFHLLPWLDAASVNTLFPGEPRVHTMQEAYRKISGKILAETDFSRRNVLICHGFFGMEEQEQLLRDDLGGSEIVSLQAFSDFSYIAAGHIHRRMPIARNAWYSGSILKYSPREISNRPSVSVVTLDGDGRMELREQAFSPLRDMRKITGEFASLLKEEPSPDYIFAELTDSELVLDPARRLRENFPNLLGVSYREQERENKSFSVHTEDAKSMSIPDLFSQFYTGITGAELTEKALSVVRQAAEAVRKEGNA